MYKRIKIKNQLTTTQFVISILFLVSICGGMLYTLYTQDVSAKFRSETWGIVGASIATLPILFQDLFNIKEYLSFIDIYDDRIVLAYKTRNTLTRTISCYKDNIQKFNFSADIKIQNHGKYTRTDVNYKIFIDLIKGEDISIKQLADLDMFESNYKFLYKVIDSLKYIPNSEINITSNSKTIQAELDYYKRFGKKIPFFMRLKTYKKRKMWGELIAILIITIILPLTILPLAPIFLPPYVSQYLSLSYLKVPTRQYVANIASAQDYIFKGNISKALEKLDNAKKIYPNDPYLSYQYMHFYIDTLKDPEETIKYAKLTLSNIDNPIMYHTKYYTPTKKDIEIGTYSKMGDAYTRLQDWENAIYALSYVIKNGEYPINYGTSYRRAKVYFKNKQYYQAKYDFLRYRKYAVASNLGHIAEIDQWIKKCDEMLLH